LLKQFYLSVEVDELLTGLPRPPNLGQEGCQSVHHVPLTVRRSRLHELEDEVGCDLPGPPAGSIEEDLLEICSILKSRLGSIPGFVHCTLSPSRKIIVLKGL